MAGALDVLLADWADRCRAAGGLVVGAHFPLPYAEIAADIVAGKIDALEPQALAPGLDDPAIRGVVPLPQPRLSAADRRRDGQDVVRGPDRRRPGVRPPARRRGAHVRAVGGRRPGRPDVRHARGRSSSSRSTATSRATSSGCRAGGRLDVSVRARAAQPVISELELVVNGRVVAGTDIGAGIDRARAPRDGRDRGRGLDRGPVAQRARDRVGVHDVDGGPHVAGLRRGRRAGRSSRRRRTRPSWSRSSPARGPGSPGWRRWPSPPSAPGWWPSSTRAWRRSGAASARGVRTCRSQAQGANGQIQASASRGRHMGLIRPPEARAYPGCRARRPCCGRARPSIQGLRAAPSRPEDAVI